MFSLRELRSIESDRVATEDRARRDAEAATVARLTADAEARAARIADAERAEREAEFARAASREAAERAARIAVEQAQHAEQVRLAAQLEADRLAHEVALRREEIAKKRPTWMLAVTALAVVATGLLVAFAVGKQHDSDAANAAAEVARVEKANAVADAKDAQGKLAALTGQLDELDGQVKAALERVRVTQNQVDRDEANRKLHQLEQQQADARARIEEQKRLHDIAVRKQGLRLDAECTNAAISKKCL